MRAGEGDPRDARTFFGEHAEAYRKSAGHRGGADLEELIRAVRPHPADTLLDVATGAGHTALSLMPLVGEVVALDLTPEMGGAFGREMKERGLSGARFVVADVTKMPFPDASFSLITCRRAAHHFPDKTAALAEMVRVLAPGGRLAVADITPHGGDDVLAFADRLERIRDASHAGSWSGPKWASAFREAGLVVRVSWSDVEEQPFETWLSPVEADPSRQEAFERAIAAAPAQVREAVVQDREGKRYFLKGRSVIVGWKPVTP